MTKNPIPQSQKRYQESLASLFVPISDLKTQGHSFIFLKSSSDVGVIRNGGRNGARFAPQSFLSHFKKFTQSDKTQHYSFSEVEVSHFENELKQFEVAQQEESDRIFEVLNNFSQSRICHIGGGHDHVYPLLKSFAKKYNKIVVINIDAHADTRDDIDAHSGTPFRQFANEYSGEFHLFQIGLHPFANSFSTLSPLKKGPQHILWKNELNIPEKFTPFFQKIKHLAHEDVLILFSLDADALDGSCMPGVSAVNGDGLLMEELKFLWDQYTQLPLKHQPILGLYELNPVFDTLSMMSMRSLGNFVYNTLN